MRVTAIVLTLALAACIRCLAGTTGVMHGYVRDANGKPVADALVRVASPSDTAQTHTDKQGFFVFLSLPPDVYTVTAQKYGMAGAWAPGARINSDHTTFLSLRMNLGFECPRFNRVTVAAYQGDDQFQSLDVQRMAEYPPGTAPLILLPPVTATQALRCL